MTAASVLRSFLLLMLFLVVQSTIGLDLRIAGVHPDLLLLLPIAYGLVGGPERGAICGFCVGVAADLLLPTPFGLSALVYCVIGFAVGSLPERQSRAGEPAGWLVSLVALAASAVAAMLYPVLGAVLGQDQMLQVDLAAVVTVVAVVNAVLAVPATAMARWGLGMEGRGRRGLRRTPMSRRQLETPTSRRTIGRSAW